MSVKANKDSLSEKGPPSSIDAESTILGAILLDNAVCNQAIELLRCEDFFLTSHRCIYDKMVALNERGAVIDLITLTDELRKVAEFEKVGGATYIASLIGDAVRTDDISYYAKIVRIKALDRRLLTLGNSLAELPKAGEPDYPTQLSLVQQYQETLQERQQLDESNGRDVDVRDRIIAADELMALEFPEPRFAVDWVLQEGINILAGRPKTGKSYFILNIAAAVASGGYALGKIRVEQGTVLYLGLEDGLRRLKTRLRSILKDGIVPHDLHFKTKWQKLDDGGLRALERWMRANPTTRLIVIDTLKKIRPKERRGARIYDLDYEPIEVLAQFAERYAVCVVVVTHTNKREMQNLEDPFDAISGSLGLTGAADAMLVLKRERGRADAVLHITGRDMDECELALNVDSGIGSWVLLGDAEEFRLSGQRASILKVLNNSFEPLGPKEIVERAKLSYDVVRQLVRKMALDSQIKSDGGGKYAVIAHSVHSAHTSHDYHNIHSKTVNAPVLTPLTDATSCIPNSLGANSGQAVNSVNGVNVEDRETREI